MSSDEQGARQYGAARQQPGAHEEEGQLVVQPGDHESRERRPSHLSGVLQGADESETGGKVALAD